MPNTVLTYMDNTEIEKIFQEKFPSQSKFSQDIEKIYKENVDMNYIESIIYYCENNNIDIESISKLVSKPLKEKLKYEAMELNFLKKSSRAKLIF
jgi:hypothetical protein